MNNQVIKSDTANGHSGAQQHACCEHGKHGADAAADEALTDPVCGMKVTRQSKHHVVHAGTDDFFCSAGCAAKFLADPNKYLKPKPIPAVAASPAGAIYTCPMHPQIRQVGPGNCPICGMALEPADASIATDDTELRTMTRRLWIAAGLSLPVALMAMTEFAPGLHQQLIGAMGPWFGWTQFVLATPVVLWCSLPRGEPIAGARSPRDLVASLAHSHRS